MKTFTIDRTTWRRGGHTQKSNMDIVGPTYLLNTEGYRCCLGQICNQLGIPDVCLLSIPNPKILSISSDSSKKKAYQKWADEFGDFPFHTAIRINDSFMYSTIAGIDDSQREKDLIELFTKYDYELEFIN